MEDGGATLIGRAPAAAVRAGRIARVRDRVAEVSGRYSAGLGIDVDAGDDEVERRFIAATMLGNRISAGGSWVVLGASASHRAGAGRRDRSAALVV